jgi:hypothetical protein
MASWGVGTTTDSLPQQPPIAELSAERYRRYQAILSNIEALGMTRSAGADPTICILVWASGWAGDTIHISVCHAGPDAPSLAAGGRSTDSYFALGGGWYGVRDDM